MAVRGETTLISVRLPTPLLERLDERAAAEDVDRTAIVVRLLESGLDDEAVGNG